MNMPWNLARQTARSAAKPLEVVEVALPESLGFALASGVRALASQPTCDTSAMDGYAVAGPGPWTVVGRVAAGDRVPGARLGAGEAFAVATGAPVPDGSDSVIPVEECAVEARLLREAASARRGGLHRCGDHDAAARQPGGHAYHGASRPSGGHAHHHGASHPPDDRTHHHGASHPPDDRTHHHTASHPPDDRTHHHTASHQPSDHHHNTHHTASRPPCNHAHHTASHQPSDQPHHHDTHQSASRPSGKHIRRRGEDWSAGDELVPAGSLVSPAVLGLAAGAGRDTVLVHRRPRVAVVVTGDELLCSGPPRPGRVRDAIGPMLPGLLTGADLLGTTHIRDDPSALADAVTSGEADVLVTCGATSAGPADHLRGVLAELGAEILVSGVACRPGHPMLLAVLPDGRCVVGLPGNPFAALAAVLTLLRPLLDTLGGHTARPPVTAWLGDAGAHPRDTRLVPVAGTAPVGHDRPGSLWGAALADALAVIPPGHRGGEVELLPL